MEAAFTRLRVPEVAVGEITVAGGTLNAHVHGEVLPRRFADVRVVSPCGARLLVGLQSAPADCALHPLPFRVCRPAVPFSCLTCRELTFTGPA